MSQQLIIFDFDETIISEKGEEKIIKEVLQDFVEYSKYPKNDVVVLTARFKRIPVISFFKALNIHDVEVVAVGELNPIAKSSFVMNRMSQKNYSAVKIYEDKKENIAAVGQVVKSLGADFSFVLVKKKDSVSSMRKFIDLTLEKEQNVAKSPGAGIVVVRKFDDKWKVLGLKIDGKYDLPKGKMEKGESHLQTALRETEEESGISDLDFKWGKQQTAIDHLTFFVAQTTQDAYIPQNPESGIYEHDEAIWMSFKKIKSKVHGFLSPVIDWAESIVIK